jgi:hypothetical protein
MDGGPAKRDELGQREETDRETGLFRGRLAWHRPGSLYERLSRIGFPAEACVIAVQSGREFPGTAGLVLEEGGSHKGLESRVNGVSEYSGNQLRITCKSPHSGSITLPASRDPAPGISGALIPGSSVGRASGC